MVIIDCCGISGNVEERNKKKENIMKTLFDTTPNKSKSTKTCKTCKHRERWECGSKIIQYCGIRKSNRTANGLLKIKAKNPSCYMYEPL